MEKQRQQEYQDWLEKISSPEMYCLFCTGWWPERQAGEEGGGAKTVSGRTALHVSQEAEGMAAIYLAVAWWLNCSG